MKHLKTFGQLNESQSSDFKQIIDFVANYNGTTLHVYDEDEEEELSFSTREHGDVGSETPGEEDFDDAYNMAKLIKQKWPKYEVEVEDVDEWVHVRVGMKKVDPAYYIFVKHSEGLGSSGFTEHYKETDIDKFKERMIQFVPVSKERADEIVAELDTMDTEKQISGYYREGALVSIVKAGDKGNKWGYNFSAVKSTRPWY